MKTFQLEIISPEKIAFANQVRMVTVPAADGQLGILAGHVPLFTNLAEGEVKVIGENEEFFLAIGSGYLEVAKNKTVILVTSAYNADEINEQEVIEAKKRAEEALTAGGEDKNLLEAQGAFRRATLALKVLHRKRSGRPLNQ